MMMLSSRHLTGAITTLVALCLPLFSIAAKAIEEPAYSVEKAWEAEQIEIRRYAPRVMAVTTMRGMRTTASECWPDTFLVAMPPSKRSR